jgi:hypothetical protein
VRRDCGIPKARGGDKKRMAGMAKRPAKSKGAKVGAKVKAKGKAKARAKTPKAAKSKTSRRTLTVIVPQTITLSLPPVLHDRLKGLSQVMGLSVEGVMRQALTEFADTWEEHHRTVASLAEGSDRTQLVVRDE